MVTVAFIADLAVAMLMLMLMLLGLLVLLGLLIVRVVLVVVRGRLRCNPGDVRNHCLGRLLSSDDAAPLRSGSVFTSTLRLFDDENRHAENGVLADKVHEEFALIDFDV